MSVVYPACMITVHGLILGASQVCPTVGANCRRNVTADAIGMAKVRGRREEERCRWCRNRVEHMHGEGHHDVPRFGALRGDNTPTPSCLFYINELELQ